jgi:hypothetical protein
MQDFGVAVLYPIILIAGALQAWGHAHERRVA